MRWWRRSKASTRPSSTCCSARRRARRTSRIRPRTTSSLRTRSRLAIRVESRRSYDCGRLQSCSWAPASSAPRRNIACEVAVVAGRGGGNDAAGMRLVLALIAVAACGDGIHPATPDADGTATVPAFTPVCTSATSAATYDDASAFGDIVPGTLTGWDPSGRWFLTGASLGDVSSVQLDKLGDGTYAFDRSTVSGALSNDSLFERHQTTYNGHVYIVAHRITNLAADGSLRMDRAQCYQGTCDVCTVKMIRATHNATNGVVEGEGDHLTL